MTPNKKQIEILHSVASGEIGLPETSKELHELICNVLLARDHEAEEAPMMEKCRSQFIKLVTQKANDDGFVYLSVIKNQLSRRAYYLELEKMLSARGITDTTRHVARSLISDGLAKRNGSEVMVTRKAIDHINQDNEF